MSFEHERSTSPLGFLVAPAHEARRARRAVGLPDTAGLLVLDVFAGSPADRAGLRQGDVLVSVAEDRLRSCLTLAQHTSEALQAGRPLDVTVLRGTKRLTFELHPADSGP
ncbi:MAG: PDZ domain-containing protein [Nocardioidaceae bacterium]